jgi:translation initiation factor 1 (eIF-1/SUI1)
MSFNLQKYLIENSLTLTGKRRLSEDVDPDETPEPTKADMKQTDKEMRDLQKNKKELAQLQAKVKDVIMKFTKDTPKGKELTDVEGYKKAIGDIPNKIKQLKKKIDAVENPKVDDSED